jgi:hypothetical protein
MGRLLALTLTAQQWRHHRAFEAATRDPRAAQAGVLRALLTENAGTLFGRHHGFGDLTAAGYARRVPIRDYEALRPYTTRVIAGERNVLTAEAPACFAATSGTTGEPKLVPVTPGSARAMAALMRLWTFHALRDHPAMLDRRVLTLVGPAVEGITPGGLPYGAMTGLTYQRLPWLVRRQHALPHVLALVRDHETRYFVALRLALAREISSIGTPNPSTLLRLAEVASRRSEELIRAIHDGTLGAGTLDPIAPTGLREGDIRAAVSAGLAPDPARAARLADVVARHGRLLLGACWPDLAVIGCWLGGSAGVQAHHLDAHFPGVPRRDLGLVASEGRLTVPLQDGGAQGVLAVHAAFFEFIAEEEIDDPAPRTRLCHELEDGRRYHVVLSGPNGLYRYDLNDVVEVRGFHHQTPRVAFIRKGRDMLSITGEKLHLNHVLHAVREAERTSGVALWQFRLVADVEASRYDLLVEAAGAATSRSLGVFAGVFDRALADVNHEYAGKRDSGRLAAPEICRMRPGWSERLCAAEFAGGRRDVQHKWNPMRAEWDAMSRTEVLERLAGERPAERVS